MTVSVLARAIDASLRSGLPGVVSVTGEVSGFRERTHWYFDLKDEGAVVNCAMFASAVRRAGMGVLSNGMMVVARGRVEFYAKGGKVTLVVESLEAAGRGALDAQLRALLEELRGLGWFDHARKRPLPAFPRRVAIITSRSGAALQDVLVTMRRRCPAVEALVVDARVQGDGAAADLIAAVREVSARSKALGVDCVLLTRGGGSMEDLWCFNDRGLAEAIRACRVPVAAAIGHETDTTVAELVADFRGATPTQAAMAVTPDREALLQQVDSLRGRLESHQRRRLRGERQRVEALAQRPVLRSPLEGPRRMAMALAGLERRLLAAGRARVRDGRAAELGRRLERAMRLERAGRLARLEALERNLHAVGPLSVLDRGYSMTTDAQGRIVRDAADLAIGARVRTRVARGEFGAIVTGDAAAGTGGTGGAEQAEPTAEKEATPAIEPMRAPEPMREPTTAREPTPTRDLPRQPRRERGGERGGDGGPGLFG